MILSLGHLPLLFSFLSLSSLISCGGALNLTFPVVLPQSLSLSSSPSSSCDSSSSGSSPSHPHPECSYQSHQPCQITATLSHPSYCFAQPSSTLAHLSFLLSPTLASTLNPCFLPTVQSFPLSFDSFSTSDSLLLAYLSPTIEIIERSITHSTPFPSFSDYLLKSSSTLTCLTRAFINALKQHSYFQLVVHFTFPSHLSLYLSILDYLKPLASIF